MSRAKIFKSTTLRLEFVYTKLITKVCEIFFRQREKGRYVF